VKCESCREQISTHYINSVFTPKLLNLLNDQLFKRQCMNLNMVECKCGNILDVMPGNVDYKQKDDEGVVISKQAAENMAKYRVRCHACNLVF
jgi:hypothetical protein